MKNLLHSKISVFLLLLVAWNTNAQVSITSSSFTYTQDFSTLVSSGTSSVVPMGWAFTENGNFGGLYTAGTGSSSAGDTYSFGPASSSERAFGGLLSGALVPTIGVCFTNNTGETIQSLTISYTGETWRIGATNRSDRLNFQYNTNSQDISGSSNWVAFTGLDYANPGSPTTGNGSMLHSALITATLTNLNIAPGNTFCFRWVDFNATGADDGMAVDDFSLSSLVTEAACPDLSQVTPNAPGIINSQCNGATCMIGGGQITAATNNCPAGSILQYAVNGGTWSTSVPVYDQDGPPQTISTRCACESDNTFVSQSSEPVTTQPGLCPVISNITTSITCVSALLYDLQVCFEVANPGTSGLFTIAVGSQTYGPYEYSNQPGPVMGTYCVTISGLVPDNQMDVPVIITDLGQDVPAPTINGGGSVEPSWGAPVSSSDDTPGWAGVNVNDLYVTSDETYVYFGVSFNNADSWQSWGFAINTIDGSGGTSEVWTYPIVYGHAQSPDFVIKGNFSGYAEMRKWSGTGWVRTDNNGNDDGLNGADFSANNAGMVEVRIRKSILTNPSNVDVQFYVSGNNQSEHATFDAVPNDEVAVSWNHNGQNGNPPATILDNYANNIPVYYAEGCTSQITYNEQQCVPCPTLAPGVKNVYYCTGDAADPLTATTYAGGTLVWYTADPQTGGQPLVGTPTPSTANPGNANYWVTESVAGCEGPAALLKVSVSQISGVTVTQTCQDPLNYSLTVCFNAFNTPGAGQFSVFVGMTQYGPFSYTGNSAGSDYYCVTINQAGTTLGIETLSVTVKDEGIVSNYTPVMDGVFDGIAVWGSPIAAADNVPGWAGANAKELYIRQDDNYVYLGANVSAASWQGWAFVINTKEGGGGFDSWSRAIDYAHTNKPDYVLRGTFNNYSQFHTWAGTTWTGYVDYPSSNYGENESSWVEGRILKSALGDPCDLEVQFYITGDNNDHGSFDAVPDDDNATSWNEQNNRTQLNNYAPKVTIEQESYNECQAGTTFTETSCGSFTLKDPCTCNNNATVAGNDGTFSEQITVTGPSGLILTATCTGCTPAALTFTETSPGIYNSIIFTHTDNAGYSAQVFSGNIQVGSISNKCAYPNVSANPIGPFTDCQNQQGTPLTAVISGDNGSGNYAWSGPGVSGSVFNPSNLTPGIKVVTLNYTGVNNGNISPDGGVTPAYPGCIQPDTIQVRITQAVAPPVIENITVCEGGNTTINVTSTPGPTVNNTFTWSFEGNITGPGVSSNTNLSQNGPVQTWGTGLTSVAFQAAGSGCTGAITSSGYDITNTSLADAVADNEYFEFCTGTAGMGIAFLGVDSIAFGHRRSGTGPISWAIVSSTNPTSPILTGMINSTSCEQVAGLIPMTGNNCYRIYYWGASGATGTLRIDNMILRGKYTLPGGSYNFYLLNPETNPGAVPVAMGTSYDPGTTPATSPDTVWVTCVDPFTGCESNPDTVVVTVLPNPDLGISQPAPICAPGTINVLQISLGAVPGGGTTSYYNTHTDAKNEQNPVLSGLDAVGNSRKVYVRYELENGCFTTDSIIVTIYNLPPAPDVPSNIVVCEGNSTNIVINTNPKTNTFTWNFEGNIAGKGISQDQAVASDGNVQSVGSGLTGVAYQPAGSGCTGAITSAGYEAVPTNTSLAEAVADNEYFEFCIGAPTPGMIFNGVKSIMWGNRASGTGPMSYAVVASNNLTTPVLTGMITSTSCETEGGTIALNPATCYRIYFWGASSTNGTLRIDNMVITAEYSSDATYSWYDENPSLNPDAEPIATGNSYDPKTTPEDSPETYYVKCTNNITGCMSPVATVTITVVRQPSITVQNACAGGPSVTFTVSNTAPGIWTVSGGGTINSSTGVFTGTTPGCFTANYSTSQGSCSDTENFVVFPGTPSAPVVNNTCNTAISVPAPASVSGFNIEYSFNNGQTWGSSNISPSTPGCYSIRTRYVLAASCGNIPQGTTAPAACAQSSPASNAVIFPAAPATPVVSNACNGPVTVPVLTNVSGFTAQYSYDDGQNWTTSNLSPATPGCYTIRTRYVLSSACGTIAQGTTAPAACAQSGAVSAVVFPAAPAISMPATTCMSNFSLPFVAPVNGFTVQYSINGGAFSTMPMTSMAPGCYTITARYVLTSACGTTAAGSTGSGLCGVSNAVTANVLPIPDVVDQPDIYNCDMTIVTPLPFTSTVNVPACLGTVITYRWTNSTPSIGLPASGVGNIPPFKALMPGIARIRVTPVIELDGVSCEGPFQDFFIAIHQRVTMACNNHLNFSLDENCSGQGFADAFLEGSYNEFFYAVTLKTQGGKIVPFDQARNYLGQVLVYEVKDICYGDICWGTVTFEDKLPPVLSCTNQEITCYQVEEFLKEDQDKRLRPETVNLRPEWSDACGAVTVSFHTYSYAKTCDGGYLLRTWTVTDKSGNSTSCTQRFDIISTVNWTCPESLVELNCNQDLTPAGIATSQGVERGYPYFLNGGVPTPIQGICQYYTSYSDTEVEACGAHCHGNKKIIRRWIVLDWCSGTLENCTQIIKSIDTEAPTFTVKDTVVSTRPWDCTAEFYLPRPWELHDNCDANPRYEVVAPEGVWVNWDAARGLWRASGAPLGVTTFTYKAYDCCGNIGARTIDVRVTDKTAPVAVAKQNIVISLVPGGSDGAGQAKMFVESVDNGSFDNCTGVRMEIRRMDNANCNNINVGNNGHNNNSTFSNSPIPGFTNSANDTDGGRFVKFCCADIDAAQGFGIVKVELRVWDDANGNGNPGDVVQGVADNYNVTWVDVRVETKIPPVITCPPNMTIFCDWAIDQNVGNGDASAKSIAGFDFSKTGLPSAYGVCGAADIRFWDREVLDQCDLGYIDRTFLVTNNGQTVKCVQRITVQQSPAQAPWVFIPSSLSMNPIAIGCDGPLAADIERNAPKYTAGPCDVIGVSTKVHQFDFEGGVCRKWHVEYKYVNWCTNEERGPFTKVFAYEDKVAPVMECEDQMFAVDGNCEAVVSLSKTATDAGGCVDGGWLKWEVYVDLWADGSQDLLYSSFYAGPQGAVKTITINGVAHVVRQYTLAPTTSGGEAKFTLPEPIEGKTSNHKVVWKVTDGCHNWESCAETFMVVDKKAPTPVCVPLTTALMQDPDGSGPLKPMVELWAIDFMNKSYDNCTDESDLLYTFEGWAPQVTLKNDGANNPMSIDHPHFFNANGGVASAVNPNTSVYKAALTQYQLGNLQLWIPSNRSSAKVWVSDTYNSGSKKEVDVKVTVWDKLFNSDYCWTTLGLLHGGDGAAPRIAGNVSTAAGQAVNNVMINVDANITEYPKSVTTGANGSYTMEVVAGNAYEITANKTGDFLNGVSTLDLVMIQRHILGLQKLDNPYKLIAADVNNDGKVTASDLTELRKLILGITPEFANNSSWRFPVKSQTLNANNPFPFVEMIGQEVLGTDVNNLDFVAVKIGDVNGNVATNVADPMTESRSNKAVVMSVAEQAVAAGDVVSVPVTAANFNEVMGYQFTMKLNGARFAGIEAGAINVDASNVGVLDNGMITMSFASNEAVSANEGAVLFTLVLNADKAANVSEMIAVTSDVTSAESYNADLEVGKVSMDVRTAPVAAIELFQNEPNPFRGQTTVTFNMPVAAKATLSIYDVTGKVVTVRNIDAVKGMNSEIFTREQVGATGVLYYTLESGDFTATKKMIIIE